MSRRPRGSGGGRGVRSGSGAGGSVTPPSLLDQVKAAWDTTVQVGGVDQRTSLFEADYYGVDGVTGKVGTFIDRIDPTHALAQTVSARQVAVPTADATLGNALTATFSAHWYDSSRAASAWRHQHSGIGYWAAGFVSALTAGRFLWCTINSSDTASKHGAFFLPSNTNRTDRLYTNGTMLLNVVTASTFTSGKACTASLSYLEGGSPEYTANNDGAQVASGASAAGTPSVADPPFTMRIGAGPTGGSTMMCRLGFLIFAPFRPSAGQLTTLNAYLLPKYGMTV
jgi:hypothetical protein